MNVAVAVPPPSRCRQPQAGVPQSARHSGVGEHEAFDPAILLTPRPGGIVSRSQSMVSLHGCSLEMGWQWRSRGGGRQAVARVGERKETLTEALYWEL